MPRGTHKSSIYITTAGGNIHFDIVSSIGLTRTKTLTKNRISNGSKITDHVVENEAPISIEAAVTDSPIVLYEENLINSASEATRSQAAYLVLKDLFEKSTVCTIVHRFDSRPNYILTSYTPIILPSKAIGFSLQFEDVRYANEKRITLIENMSSRKKKDSTSSTTGSGGKTTVTDEEGVLARSSAALEEALILAGIKSPATPTTGVTP